MASSKQETECVVRLLASRIDKFVHCHRASRKDVVHLGLVNPPVTSWHHWYSKGSDWGLRNSGKDNHRLKIVNGLIIRLVSYFEIKKKLLKIKCQVWYGSLWSNLITFTSHVHAVKLICRLGYVVKSIRWMYGVKLNERKKSEELRELLGLEPVSVMIKKE